MFRIVLHEVKVRDRISKIRRPNVRRQGILFRVVVGLRENRMEGALVFSGSFVYYLLPATASG